MLIKMICGNYGALEGGVVTVKTNQSAPFEVEEKRAMQLIASGYAIQADTIGTRAEPVAEQNADQYEDQYAEVVPEEELLEYYSAQELKRKAKDLGLSTAGTKEQLINRIKDHLKLMEEDAADDNEDREENAGEKTEAPPTLQPAEPE